VDKQRIEGLGNVQIGYVGPGSNLTITIGGAVRELPLQRAGWPLGEQIAAPSMLVRARYREVPYVDRAGLLGELAAWLREMSAFQVCVIAGRGGSGKTRLAVELCERQDNERWVSGLLDFPADQAALDALIQTPKPRLVVVDYAETRAEQLDALLPLLARAATPEHPVRVALLVRAMPRDTGAGWHDVLRPRAGDAVDALLNDLTTWILEDLPLRDEERELLYREAGRVFAQRASVSTGPLDAPDELAASVYSMPLMVVIAAYLAVHSKVALPTTRWELLNELLRHEDRYWERSAGDRVAGAFVRREVVALATLAGATNPAEAANVLALIPDLQDASAERRGTLSRWMHHLYPSGSEWWNPLEPDVIGEHLVATTYAREPGVLAGVLARDNPAALVRPLTVFARAAPNYPDLAEAVSPILSERLPKLCRQAAAQLQSESRLDWLLGDETLASALRNAARAIKIAPDAAVAALDELPLGLSLTLSPLAIELKAQRVNDLNEQVAARSALTPDLAVALTDLSATLVELGRTEEALAATNDAVAIFARLPVAHPRLFQPELATALSNQSAMFRGLGRHKDAVSAAQAAVNIYRTLGRSSSSSLAAVLGNLSAALANVERRQDALTAIEESVTLQRQMADQRTPEDLPDPDFTASLTSYANRLSDFGRWKEALVASREAVEGGRRLAHANADAYLPGLALSLHNHANMLRNAGQPEDAAVVISETVSIRRRLADARPEAFLEDLAISLTNESGLLMEIGRPEQALPQINDAILYYRQLSDTRPEAYLPEFAMSLNTQAGILDAVGQYENALAAMDEAVEVFRRLAAARGGLFDGYLATVVDNAALMRRRQASPRSSTPADSPTVMRTEQILVAAPHPTADPERAAQLNRQFIEDLRRWEALPRLKRLRTPKPRRPKGI
jgi:tetratricopeptide (TPR) repeat protein